MPWLSIEQAIALARRMSIDFIASTSWMGFLTGLFILGLVPLLALTLTWSSFSERILSLMEFPECPPGITKVYGWVILVVSTMGYTIIFAIPFVQRLFGDGDWIRFLVFWSFSLTGLIAVKIIWHDIPWFTSFLSVVLVQTTFHLLAVNFSYVTSYPFAMGWSETSRYYHPSLFLSKAIYRRSYPLPVLHPTLHLLLVPPYLFDAPLWIHRFWQVAIRLFLLAVTASAMVRRISMNIKRGIWFIGLWFFIYLLMGPVYFHLTIPVILILIGYSPGNGRRNWLVLLLASAWCGWSRVNWFPVPAMILAVLYVLETPNRGKSPLQYLIKPAMWGVVGVLTAFAFQRIYIVISGVENINYFYTSLVSDLLWYRLSPNTTFPMGILPAAILFSFPIWLVMFFAIRLYKDSLHPIRLFLLFAALLTLFLVGILVSLKIGGGADLHNMDSYFIVLLLMTAYLAFARFRKEEGMFDSPISLHWALVALLIAVPIWWQIRSSAGIITYDRSRTNAVLSTLQDRVDQVNEQDGEILFITQRHLISMNMLHNVNLIPEYEREDLMEMAMGRNTEYLSRFRNDMKDQRFSLIVADPVSFQYFGRERSFAEENNVWVRQVMKYILCNYRLDVVFPEDDIALYVPQVGERRCP